MSDLTRPRRARIAATIAFATNGSLPATFFARYAEVKDGLELSAAVFGLLVVGYALGASGAFHLPGVIVRRFGITLTTSVGTTGIAMSIVLAGVGVATGTPWLFLAGLVFAGFGDAVVDVAQNAQGLKVQEVYGRSVLNSMHAGWSLGAVVGGLVGTAAASAGVSLVVHLVGWGIVCSVVMTIAGRYFLPDRGVAGEDEAETGPLTSRAFWLLVPVVLVAFAGMTVEDVGSNWSAVLLNTERNVPLESAGIGLSVVLGAQFVGRIFGDRFIDLVGERGALLTSLATSAGGLALAAWAPSSSMTLVGLGIAGLGCAITVPLAYAQADRLPGLRPHAGVTWVGWAMRAGMIGLSPAIGGITSLASLPIALTVVCAPAVIALVIQLRKPSAQ